MEIFSDEQQLPAQTRLSYQVQMRLKGVGITEARIDIR